MTFFSNATYGDFLDAQCDDCIHGLDADVCCPIALVQMYFNYGQSEKIERCLNMLVDKNGYCQMKPLIDKYYKKLPEQEPEPEYAAPEWKPKGKK